MTEQLKEAVSRAEQLPQEQQDAIAQLILDQLDEQEWDILLNSQKGKVSLQQLIAQAKQEIITGEAEEIKEDTFDS